MLSVRGRGPEQMKLIKHCISLLLFMAILVSTCLATVNPALAKDDRLVDKTIVDLDFNNDLKQPIRLKGADSFQLNWLENAIVPISMVADAYGNLYYSDAYNIYAVSSEGNKLWTYNYRSWRDNIDLKYLTLGQDGNLYAFAGSSNLYDYPEFPDEKNKKGDLLVLDTKGNKLWGYKFTEPLAFYLSIGAADAEGNFIALTNKGIVSINKEGKLNWTNNVNVTFTRIKNDTSTNIMWIQVDQSETVFIGDENGFLYALDASTGATKWKSNAIIKKYSYYDYPYIGYDGYIYVTSDKGIRVFLAKDGSEINKTVTRDDLNRLHIPNDDDSGLYLTNEYEGKDGKKRINSIKNIDHNGNVKWIYKTPDSAYGPTEEITSDDNGNVYFTDYGGNVYSLDRNGNERFRIISNNSSRSLNFLHVSDKGELYSLNDQYGLIRIEPIVAITLWIDGEEVIFPLEPRISDGVPMVPMRAIFEKLGAKVTWNGENRSITAVKETKEINLKIDHTLAMVNGKELEMQVAPTIVDGSTLVPLRFVSEALGAQVLWDVDTSSIKITTKL
jgi:outer membrane protein assembly factor BamB